MVQHFTSGFLPRLRNGSCAFLAFCWVSGLAAGVLNYAHNPDALTSLMRRIPFAPASIVWLQFLFLLPFLLSAFAVYLHAPVWIFPISLCKAFLFAFVSSGLLHSTGHTGWLYQGLLLAGDLLSMPMLYLYWIRSLSKKEGVYVGPLLWLLFDAILVWNVNSRFVLQFFAEHGNR